MELWEIDLRAELNETVPNGMYEIGIPGKLVAFTGKQGYINYLVEIERNLRLLRISREELEKSKAYQDFIHRYPTYDPAYHEFLLSDELKDLLKPSGGGETTGPENMSKNKNKNNDQESPLADGKLIETIAKACHEANRIWCQHNGDMTQDHWDGASVDQRTSALNGVEWRLKNPDAPVSAQHEAWVEDKKKNGWVYGETKDPVAKTHPCMVDYDDLPEMQRKKDALFVAIVQSLAYSTGE